MTRRREDVAGFAETSELRRQRAQFFFSRAIQVVRI